MARQIVLQDNKLEVKSQMYMDLKKYIVNYSSDDSKRTMVEIKETEDLLPSTKQEIPLGNTTKIQSPTLER